MATTKKKPKKKSSTRKKTDPFKQYRGKGVSNLGRLGRQYGVPGTKKRKK